MAMKMETMAAMTIPNDADCFHHQLLQMSVLRMTWNMASGLLLNSEATGSIDLMDGFQP
jgi:hypothetical protein